MARCAGPVDDRLWRFLVAFLGREPQRFVPTAHAMPRMDGRQAS
jgi:hypothetical protein